MEKLGLLHAESRSISLSEGYELYLTYCRDIEPISESKYKRDVEGQIRSSLAQATGGASAPHVHPGSGNWSVSQIYQAWLPTLSSEILSSADLLT